MLQQLVPGAIWYTQRALDFGPLRLTTRMTVVRLADGSLWVHSPVPPDPALRAALDALGPVAWVVAPNRSHHLFFRAFMAAYPDARGFVAPGLGQKVPALRDYPELGGEAPWQADLQGYFIHGLPVLNETVWFHPASGTLLLTDLLFCFGADNGRLTSFVAALLGVRGRLGMSRTMKWMVRDKASFRASVAPVRTLPVQRVLVAHDSVIDQQAPQQLAAAFQWLD